MAVLPADLIAPKGEIEPTLFATDDAGGSVTSRVTEAIAEAVTAGATDKATKAWAYYRLFGAKAQQLADTPDTMSADGQSQSWGMGRIQYYESKARSWLAQYNAAMDEPSTPPQTDQPRSRSVSVRTVF